MHDDVVSEIHNIYNYNNNIYNINSKKVMEKLQNANNNNNEEVLDGLYNAGF